MSDVTKGEWTKQAPRRAGIYWLWEDGPNGGLRVVEVYEDPPRRWQARYLGPESIDDYEPLVVLNPLDDSVWWNLPLLPPSLPWSRP